MKLRYRFLVNTLVTSLSLVGWTLFLIWGLNFTSPAYSARESRPFWTEKSSFIEGEDLLFVGVASRAQTVEEGRRQAFEQGKVELMNFAQITSAEAYGLVIETQMTFEEPNADGTMTVYRLFRVPLAKLLGIQGRLKAEGRVQAEVLDKSRKELEELQKTLIEKKTEWEQQRRSVEEMSRLFKEQIRFRSGQVCKLVGKGMTKSEVKSLLGKPDSVIGTDYWEYRNATVRFSSTGFVDDFYGC